MWKRLLARPGWAGDGGWEGMVVGEEHFGTQGCQKSTFWMFHWRKEGSST